MTPLDHSTLDRPVAPKRPPAAPTLRYVRQLAAEFGPLVAGCDEVGRGALAGPVSVGVVVIDARSVKTRTVLRDSKLLAPERRIELVPLVRKWAVASAVGHASAEEIDDVGLMEALRLAGARALGEIEAAGVVPDVVHLDGNYDWLGRGGQGSLFGDATPVPTVPVRTMIKADLKCQAVAAASILAKVERDGLMGQLGAQDPRFGWAVNKGYATPEHRAALQSFGPTMWHRRSWNLDRAAVEALVGDGR
ncbi:ribonuclease HII [Sinomonas sp. ASV322]|uniref:ribonuclease HII n=1 Tax=Sinomonas sp. ASV322 TaxID=3041920 RepID=UPI0027DB1650|nr:ribonuclease HII [Sinomonas sp. ASV322]MDQ4502268.1 ribonuclease HII [Sinomonas sp. ASV322]